MSKRLKTDFTIKSKIVNSEVEFPKNLRPILNLANRFSGATNKKNIGDLGSIFKTFRNNTSAKNLTIQNWRKFYINQNPDAIKNATKKITDKYLEFVRLEKPETKRVKKSTIKLIQAWVEDLVFNKTFNGLMTQEQILKAIAKENDLKFSRSSSQEDSKGIDGYVGNVTISVKPASYMRENIQADKVVYYNTNKDKTVSFE